jgi:hypothetical protein
MPTNIAAVPVRSNTSFRCITLGCGTWHDSLPILSLNGEKRQVFSLCCPACAQRALENRTPRYVAKWDAGVRV